MVDQHICRCIFTEIPDGCVPSVASNKLLCMLNHRHMLLTDWGKNEVVELVKAEASHPRRYKTESGEEQRES